MLIEYLVAESQLANPFKEYIFENQSNVNESPEETANVASDQETGSLVAFRAL